MRSQTSDDLLVRSAWMYYHDEMTQEQIAERLGLSRVKVTRLLQQAREAGIVKITLTRPLPPDFELGRRLEAAFGLAEAVVVPNGADETRTSDSVGRAAAEHLIKLAAAGGVIGFGWSSTVSKMAPYLQAPRRALNGTICDLVGSMVGQTNPYSISGRVARTLGIPLKTLPVPVIVNSRAARDAMLSEPALNDTLQTARISSAAFVGVGEISEHSTLIEVGYMTVEEMEDLRARGAVGEVLMRFYDIHGEPLRTHLDERIIGLDWDEIAQIPHLVVVASNAQKIAPILGILRSGLCRALITDMQTAASVLDMHDSAHSTRS